MITLNIKSIFLTIFITTGLSACGVDVGGSEDKNRPSITLTSLNSGEEVIGTFNEKNRAREQLTLILETIVLWPGFTHLQPEFA